MVEDSLVGPGVPRIQLNLNVLGPFAALFAELEAGDADEPIRRRNDHRDQR